MDKTVLIVGAGGQDGPYLANYLISEGYYVIGATHPVDQTDVIRIRAPKMELILADATDAVAITDALDYAAPDEIYRLASYSVPSLVTSNPLSSMDVEVKSTILLLDWVKKHPEVKLFNASSAAIFGDEPPPHSETTRFRPQDMYAIAKITSHELVRIYREKHGLYAVNGILFNHESLWRPDYYVTMKVARHAGSYMHVELGNVGAVRDWGYAGDYVKAMHLLLQQDVPDDICIGTGHGHTVEELARLAYGYVKLEYEQYVTSDSYDSGDTRIADPRRIADLGWTATVPFEDVIESMVYASSKTLTTEDLMEADQYLLRR